MFSFEQIMALVFDHPYVVLLPLTIIEGPLVTLACGVLIAVGRLNPFLAFGIVIAGDLIGDAILYSLGRWAGDRVISIFRNNSRIAVRIKALKTELLGKADRALVIGKLTHGVGALVLLAAGMVRMPFVRFMAVEFGSTLLKSLALLVAGYWIGSSYQLILDNSLYVSGALLLVGVVAFWAMLFRRRAKTPETEPHESVPRESDQTQGSDETRFDLGQGQADRGGPEVVVRTMERKGSIGATPISWSRIPPVSSRYSAREA